MQLKTIFSIAHKLHEGFEYATDYKHNVGEKLAFWLLNICYNQFLCKK